MTKEILDSMISLSSRPSNASFVLFRTVWRVMIEFYGLLRFSKVSNLNFSDIHSVSIIVAGYSSYPVLDTQL